MDPEELWLVVCYRLFVRQELQHQHRSDRDETSDVRCKNRVGKTGLYSEAVCVDGEPLCTGKDHHLCSADGEKHHAPDE